MKLICLQICLFTCALLLSGCNILDNMSMRGEPALTLPVNEIIPAEWKALGNLQNISIDGDPDPEILLFYNYDNNPNDTSAGGKGPVGALIYDIQIDSASVTGDTTAELYPIPNQPSGFYIPYRLLPNYWEPAIGQTDFTSADARRSFAHFVAMPNVAAANIAVEQVTRLVADELGSNAVSGTTSGTGADTASSTSGGTSIAGRELIIRGGTTHITIAWWKNAFDGYGVVQLHAPYGFSEEEWGGGTKGVNPINSIVGSFPENDRSRLCRKVRYTRFFSPVDDGRAGSQPAIHYVTTELGLFFCDAIPAHPFYPEGVVLAYLKDPIGHGRLVSSPFEADYSTAALQDRLSKQVYLDSQERIEGIYTRAGMPHLNAVAPDLGRVQGGPHLAWQTNVCVELVDPANAVRQLRFRLHHRPPTLEPRQTDRWYIMDLVPEPYDGLSCYDFIRIRPPDR